MVNKSIVKQIVIIFIAVLVLLPHLVTSYHYYGQNVGGQPQLDTVSSETVVATDDTTSANVLLPPLTEVTLALIRVKVPYPLING